MALAVMAAAPGCAPHAPQAGLNAATRGVDAAPTSAPAMLDLSRIRPGSYPARPFIDTLRQTRSVNRDLKSSQPQAIEATLKDGVRTLMCGYDFHEAEGGLVPRPDGEFRADPGATGSWRVVRIAWYTFTVRQPGLADETCVHVGPVDDEQDGRQAYFRSATGILLSGDHLDAAGRPCRLTDTGDATFPEGPAHYGVNLDEDLCCELADVSYPGGDLRSQETVFRWKGDVLAIHRAHVETGDSYVAPTPDTLMLSLRRVR